MTDGLHGKNFAQSKTLCTWRSSLRGTWEVSPVPGLVPGRLGEGNSRTPSMEADEKSDEVVVLRKRPNKGRQLPAEVVEGRASPKGNSRQAAVVRTLSRSYHVDPNAGCASSAERVKPAPRQTFDPREEPGALAAHAGIWCSEASCHSSG
jgi:hypothetical protein